MEISADEYYRASLERMREALLLYREPDGSYSFAMYSAGLSVECMLRALTWKRGAAFDGRHDLTRLFNESRLLTILEDRLRRQGRAPDEIERQALGLRTAMNNVILLWSNAYRYASSKKVHSELKRRGLFAGIKGDILKEQARRLIGAADEVVKRGTNIWNSEKKSSRS